MSVSTGPAEIFHRLVAAVAERRQGQLIEECYAEDVVVEHPFMVPEPLVTEGRDRLGERVRQLAALPITMEVDDIVVHETADPEVVVGEFRSHITSKATGKRITTRNILVLRVRDGIVVSSRDYHDHAAMAALLRPSAPE